MVYSRRQVAVTAKRGDHSCSREPLAIA